MNATIQMPPHAAAAAPRPLRWTCAEFHDLGDRGVFEGRRAMLIDGVILEQGPMNAPHGKTLGRVERALQKVFGAEWWQRHQLPLVLGQDIDPMPDIAIVPAGALDYEGHPDTARQVVEVSDSSLAFDTTEKRLIYARAGIPEYWVVDINGRRLLVYRDPQSGDYASRREYGPADALTPLAAGAEIRVGDLLV